MGKAASGEGFVSVTPSDTVDISMKNDRFPRALYFGTGGSCTIVGADGSLGVFTNIPNGFVLNCDCKRVNSSGLTGCAGIIGFY
jgi:hypothetical protein